MRTDRPQECRREELDFIRQYLGDRADPVPDRLNPLFAIDPGVTGAAVPDLYSSLWWKTPCDTGSRGRPVSPYSRSKRGARLIDSCSRLTDDGPGPDDGPRREGVGPHQYPGAAARLVMVTVRPWS